MIMRYIFLLTAMLVPAYVQAAGTDEKPNIVFVLFDDFGYGQPPSYSDESPFKTPNFDRLAREGMRFTDAHSAASNCTPTRYGLLTGRYPSRIGQFGVLKTYNPPIIPRERMTVASLLKKHGYHTACVGKWHLGLNWVDGKPGTQKNVPVGAKLVDGPWTIGFDYFCGFTHAGNISTVIENKAVIANVEPVENQPLMLEKALAYLERRSTEDQPFFLYFPTCPPHTPVVPAPEFIGRSGVQGKDSLYGDWILQGDDMLGQLLEALDRMGLAENTLVIATGDNGAAKRAYPPLREAKGSIYEGGHREPFVARWPGKIAAGSECQQTICLTDWIATCADLLDERLPAAAGEDSVSILPYLLGEATEPIREATIHQAPYGLAIRQGPWKLLFHDQGGEELYNLDADLSETTDVAAEHPAVVERLTKLFQSYIDRGRSTHGEPQKNEFAMGMAGNRDRGAR